MLQINNDYTHSSVRVNALINIFIYATMHSIWKRPSCQAQVFSRAAFLGDRPGSNPQPIELCADIGQVHLMLI
jgi:hypothetical protein